jgi:hypothetical protein
MGPSRRSQIRGHGPFVCPGRRRRQGPAAATYSCVIFHETFQDSYARQKTRHPQDRPGVRSREHHSAIRRRGSERFGEFLEFLG